MEKISSRALGVSAIIAGAIGICLLVLPYLFYPQFYVSKANSSMGYTSPATIEGWAFMIAGLCLVGFTIVLRVIYRDKKFTKQLVS